MNSYSFAWVLLLCVALAEKDAPQIECPIITGEAIGEVAIFSSELVQQMVPEGKEDLSMSMLLHDVPGFELFLNRASAYTVPLEVEPTTECPVDKETLSRLLEEFEKQGRSAPRSNGRKLMKIKKGRERSKARCFCIKPCKVFPQLNCNDDDKHCMCD